MFRSRLLHCINSGVAPDLLHWACALQGGGKGASAPPPPDYRGAAIEQGQASKENIATQTFANRPDLNTPWGSQHWTPASGTDPSTGLPVTTWTGDITLDPDEQAALDSQQRVNQGRSGAAETLLGQATGAFQKPFDWAGMPNVPGSLNEAQKGAFATMAAALEKPRARETAALTTRLSNMGLHEGSEAWNNEMARLSEERAQQDRGLLTQALAEGRSDVSTERGMRDAAIAEEAKRRGMTLNELNALLTGQQVQFPQGMAAAPGTTAGAATPANLLGAAVAQGNYDLNATQLAQSGGTDWGSAVGGIASVASAFM